MCTPKRYTVLPLVTFVLSEQLHSLTGICTPDDPCGKFLELIIHCFHQVRYSKHFKFHSNVTQIFGGVESRGRDLLKASDTQKQVYQSVPKLCVKVSYVVDDMDLRGF